MKKLGAIVCAICCFSVAAAAVKLPPLLADNMVLQQRGTVRVWGWADPGEIVRVNAGWLKAPVTAVADSNGHWQATLATTKAGGPYSMTITGQNRIELKNIMLGEVWLCSGQSNMEFTIEMLGGWKEPYAADSADLLRNNYSSLRLFTVARATSDTPVDTCRGVWHVAGPEAVKTFSATAYFFGRELSRRLNVPIGLISSSWGGTPAESWTRPGDLEANSELAFYLTSPNRTAWFPGTPGILFNAMIHPLINYPVRGVIWYQGESNRNDADLYRTLMSALIAGWRKEWNVGDLPFYYVQIAPFSYEEPLSSALLREAQLKTMTVPKTGMVVTSDIGDIHDIHPKNKQEVGRRLALWALARTYGIRVPAFSGPLYRSMRREGNAVRIEFDHAGRGLTAGGEKVGGFVIAGADRVFVDAEAKIQDATVLVSSPKVAHPAAVRFAFTDTSQSALFNRAGLPASPFRTDDWPIVTAAVSITAAYDSAHKGTLFSVSSKTPGHEVRYTLDGSEPTVAAPLAEGLIHLADSGSITARAFKGETGSSFIARREFVKHAALGNKVTYNVPPDPTYSAGGTYALVDGVSGSENYRDGSWQGFQKNDLDVTIDLGDTLQCREIRAGFLQNTGSWIFFPMRVEYSLSLDGTTFGPALTVPNDGPDSASVARRAFPASLPGTPARHIRVRAANIGQCPPWHAGRGRDAWLFVDEIIVQ